MAGAPRDLGGGVWQFQTSLWQTNSLLAAVDGAALLCDPSFRRGEIEAIRAEAVRRAGGAIHLLLTHADFDHTCGIGFFPEATVVAGPETARAVASGDAGAQLRAAGEEWGEAWPAQLRVDRVVEAGSEFVCGPFRVAAIDARGHVGDGLAYVLLDLGVLLPGDYLSASTYPFATASVTDARRTCERLLAALAAHDLRWVVPGHGPALTPAEARAVGEADLAYLGRLEEAAREARQEGLAPGPALLTAYAIVPPRENPDDLEIYGIRAANARRALAEAGEASGWER